MDELRSVWSAEEVAEQAGESDEGLPEATPVHRQREVAAAGADHLAGDEPYDEPDALGPEPSQAHRVPPDPPLRPDAAAPGEV